MTNCPNCGNQLEEGAVVCSVCATPVEQTGAPVQAKKGGGAKKFILIGAIAAAVVVLAIILISALSGSSYPDYALYIRDGELFYSNFSGKPTEISSDLYDGATNETLSSTPSSSWFTVTQDGKRIFYVDKYKDGVTLYTKDLTKSKADAEKIDSDIAGYVVSEDGKTVTYLKTDGDSYILYQHDLKEKNKVASGVEDFIVSMDAKKIIYLTDEADMYSYNGKEADKISSSVSNIYMVDKKLSKICYLKDNDDSSILYIKDGKKDAEKIASDVVRVKAYATGELYYFTSVEVEEGDTVDMIKQTFLENLSDAGFAERNLYYYDGKKAEKVTTAMMTCSFASDAAVALYASIDYDDIDLTKLTEEGTNVETMIKENMDACILSGKKLLSVSNWEDITTQRLSKDGTVMYYISDVDEEKKCGDLYKMTISKDKLGKAERIDTDVSTTGLVIVSEKNLPRYYKEINKEGTAGELYINKQRIDFDVRLSYSTYIEENDTIVYFTDWNAEKKQGTLKVSTLKGKSTKISDDVYDFEVTPNGDILYLYDYNITSYKGELHYFNGKKSKKLDDDVVRIITYYNSTVYMYTQYDWVEDWTY